MITSIIRFSLNNKLTILLFVGAIILFGVYSLVRIPIGAVPDITNNQVQVITTSRNLSTQDVEQFITYPVELEMSNLPGVKEIRSISKFGLSVVTIVFEDGLGTYLPRQLIAEKIIKASENIPEGFGIPELGPITTGLGEIYQYTLEVEPEYRDMYSTMDLRTIQDWIIKRQLSGIPGVVEVNTWGGKLKQYEVRVDPIRLRAMGISLTTIFHALELNNSVAGGGYIEKSDQAYFVRGEGLTETIEDIENIVVETRDGLPVYIKDVATVSFGHATRFGAITGNGEGEKVFGQVMMLKNANSLAVIRAVRERVEEIKETLPEGIYINPVLDRSELISRTTTTISENLIFGCLIVIFVVVLLLGNIRSGLVVASVIPISLLFALSLMYAFGIDANLMSLGAIDFGIIIDGAVIIVEYITFSLTNKSFPAVATKQEKQSIMDQITFESTHKMMHSAVFGQLIIIIVFIPILSLADVEGKMFRPMALTFVFALIGAMILCFTYVPVISSIFLNPKSKRLNVSVALLEWLKGVYSRILDRALVHRKAVLSMALAVLAGGIFLFTRLGGEFVPTLDEGDFVIQPVLKTGTSLSKTVEIMTDIERIVGEFPEVEQVVTRIGAAEVPTDPMSMEETDVIITLIPRHQWITASTKDELANKMKEALQSQLMDVDYEFTQPIEMRFNELITGVRADLAIKIFGEDLAVLAGLAEQIESLIEPVEGASDITVEKIVGLPQMRVKYNRDKIARYGLNISEVNQVISMGFAGKVAGSVFEGEKRFDLVLRFQESSRADLRNLKNSFVTTPSGQQVPLDELAEISYTTGPAKISRDNTKRRIVIGVNVRNRDLESVVEEVRSLIGQSIKVPAGYRITYGGQFENLQSARERLMLAVPIALILIFVMLYLAFHSIREALLIYTAIPLAAVGGVLFLWLRGLPFSISAGVGFIALFGIAVLNGIVMIGNFKGLRSESPDNLLDLIKRGSVQRLRPVLLTASAAALGFLPMALSTSSGAEVQRPLATVVIGGLITATLLTLVVLPTLYFTLEKRRTLKPKATMILIFLLGVPFFSMGQEELTLEQALASARKNNAQLKSMELGIKRQEALKGAAFDFENTNVFYHFDEANIAPNGNALRVWGLQQSFRFPSRYSTQNKLNNQLINLEQSKYNIELKYLQHQVSRAWYSIVYLQNLQKFYHLLDSAYARFSQAAERRFELGETNILEKLTAESQQNEIRLKLKQVGKELEQSYEELDLWVQSEESFLVPDIEPQQVDVIPWDSLSHPGLLYFDARELVTEQTRKLNSSAWLPDVYVEYFQGNDRAENAEIYRGIQLGLGIPLLFNEKKSRVKAARVEQEKVAMEKKNYQRQLSGHYQQLLLELEKYNEALINYRETGNNLSSSLIRTANRSFESGEIDFFQYILTLERGVEIQIDYLLNLNQYNDTALAINYLLK